MSEWNFLTNHARVLTYIAQHTESTLREAAMAVGMTDRGVVRILRDFEKAGLLCRHRVGRNVHYAVDLEAVFRYPTQTGQTLGEFVGWLADFYRRGDGSDSANGDSDAERGGASGGL